jgi:hypothetical protein
LKEGMPKGLALSCLMFSGVAIPFLYKLSISFFISLFLPVLSIKTLLIGLKMYLPVFSSSINSLIICKLAASAVEGS